MTISTRLSKQRKFRAHQYALRLTINKERYMPDFELRAKLYGRNWASMIWELCQQIKRGEK